MEGRAKAKRGKPLACRALLTYNLQPGGGLTLPADDGQVKHPRTQTGGEGSAGGYAGITL